MSNLYVRSTDGLDADNGTTWALAKALIAGAAAIDVAGDVIYVSKSHAESSLSSQTWALAGTYASPVRVICVDDTGDPQPPTTVSTLGGATVTGASSITISGVGAVYGLIFTIGTGGNTVQLNLATNDQNFVLLEDCKVRIPSTSTNSRLTCGTASAGVECKVDLINTTVRFGAAGQRMEANHCRLHWRGGGIESGGTAPSALFDIKADQVDILAESLDLSAGATSMAIVGASALGAGKVVVRDCKLPASWTGSPATPTGANVRVELWNCSDGAVNYGMWVSDYFGDIVPETTRIRTGGASDGTTGLAWKMTASADAEFPMMVLYSPEILIRNETVGSAVTLTAHILRDSLTNIKDDELWLEVQYLGSSGTPIGTMLRSVKASWLTTAANLAASTETWTTTGMTNPNKQKAALTFTPNMKGCFRVRLALAKASEVVYLCPKIEVS